MGFGVRLGEQGVLRTTVRLNERKRSNRAEPDTRQQYFGTNATTGAPTTPSGNYGSGTGLTPPNGTLDPREATVDRDNHWLGDLPFKAGTVFVNGELPVGSVTLYTFGGYSRLKGTSQGFFRRAGDDRNVRALYPNGFRPYTDSTFENSSLAAGVGVGGAGGAQRRVQRVIDTVIEQRAASGTAEEKRVLGAPGFGKVIGLDDKWVFNVIKQVGNYAEVWGRNLGKDSPLKVPRGVNALWRNGGLYHPYPWD